MFTFSFLESVRKLNFFRHIFHICTNNCFNIYKRNCIASQVQNVWTIAIFAIIWNFENTYLDTLSWFRVTQSLLFLLNAACLAEKQQPDQGEKLVPNTFIMFFFYLFIYRIKSCSYSYPDLFSRTWWLLNIYKKNIVLKSNGKFGSEITWPLDIPVSSLMMFVILQFLIYCISPKFISEKRFPFCQIIHCKLSITVIVGTKRHKYLHGIHV